MPEGQEPISIETVQTLQKFIMDRNESMADGKSVSYHRNGMFQTVKNTEIFAVNEPANLECIKLPNTYYYGEVKLTGDNRHLVFTGDDNNISEFGIADIKNCTYISLASAPCLNFRKKYNPITGALRLNEFGEEEVIITDGNNPDRIINLSKLPYEFVVDEISKCKTKEYSNKLDCAGLKLNPNIQTACLELTPTSEGNLPDGVYFVHIAYVIGENRFTDYMSSTLPVQINNKAGNSSFSVDITHLDQNFEKYQLILTGVVKGIPTHKYIGRFYTSQSNVRITDWVNEEYKEGIPSDEITNTKVIYDNAGIIQANSETLFRADLQKATPLNYQKQAYSIKGYYVVKQVPLDYYKKGGQDVGYFRNEVYRYVIRWYKTNGEVSPHSQLITYPKGSDILPANGSDVFEKEGRYNYEIYNTAGKLIKTPNEDTLGYGELGFWQSTEKFPNIPELFGEQACTELSFHMMPDEEKIPRFQIIDGETFINILGVRFEGIEHPKDEDGKYIEDISHYEILRSERDESNSRVVARGVTTNMGEFENDLQQKVLYSNFPFNDVSPNLYISKTQPFKKHNKEYDYNPLDKFHTDKFSFYSPFGNYFGRKSLAGSYLQFETEERGTTEGYFEEVYKHPKHKLLTNYTLLVAATLGVGEALATQMGKEKTKKTRKGITASTGTNTSTVTPIPGPLGLDVEVESGPESVFDFPKYGEFIKAIRTGTAGGAAKIAARSLLLLIQTVAVPFSILFLAAQFAETIIDAVKAFSPFVQYAYQYNSEVLYNTSKKINKGQKRRKFLRQPFYLDNGVHRIGDYSINNGGRNSSIFMEIETPVAFPSGDNSRNTMSGFGLNKDSKQRKVNSTSSVYYTSVMKYNPNQYGTIDGVKPVKIYNCPIEAKIESLDNTFYNSPVFFGGDCIIAEQTHTNKFPLFKQNLANANFPNGIEFDYKLYSNVGFARYWINTTGYDIGNLLKIFGKATPTNNKLPNSMFNLDLPNAKKSEWVEKDQVFYTSVNGVIRYIGEVEYNISFRDNKEEGDNEIYQPHYDREGTADLSYIFRSDLQPKKESFILDPSYKFLSQKYVASYQLSKLFPNVKRETNTVLYSLPSGSDINSIVSNGWRYFLPNNTFTFDRRDFGELTGIHSLDQDRLIFLFSKASPYLSLGRSMLKLENQNVVIGDGGVFAQAPREMMHTDVSYGSNHDRHAFSSTQFGPFYVSEHQGKLFKVGEQLTEISRDGWHKWAAEFIPLQFKKQFPNWKGIHNPINGVGYQIVFDNIYETVYFCKKDYIADSAVTLNEETEEFEANGIPIVLGDPLWFYDCSLTLSYAPGLEGFQSFHDWHPDAVIQDERHFSTVKNQTIWKHNVRTDLFCNYYGVDRPYQLGIIQSTGQQVNELAAIEYIQEAYTYKTSELDRYKIQDSTFDWATLSSAAQHSGLLRLIDATNIRYAHMEFPKVFPASRIEIPYKKVENKHRFNMFYDMVVDKRNFRQPIITKKNGYDFEINQPALNLEQQRPPRLRYYWHNAWFSKEKCDNIQYITKFINFNLIKSPR